jgi:hypothetical protein
MTVVSNAQLPVGSFFKNPDPIRLAIAVRFGSIGGAGGDGKLGWATPAAAETGTAAPAVTGVATAF